MPDDKNPEDVSEESGAGYGNNAETDVVGKPGETTEDEPEAHAS